MKLHDRQSVEGTMPVIYIGHREYRRPNGQRYISRQWYSEWCVHGRHYSQALKTTNKQLALRRAHDIRRRIEEGQLAPKVFKLNSTQLKDRYLDLKRNENRAPKTIEKYTAGPTQFDVWCNQTGRASIVKFSGSDFWTFNGWMRDQGHSEKTRYDRLVLVKQAFKYAAKEKMIPENLLFGITLYKPEPTEQPCFTPQQVAVLLATADVHEAAIFAVLAYLGLRFGEARDLRWSDIHWNSGGDGGFVSVCRGGSRNDKTKTGRSRRIPLHPALVPYLATVPRKFERVFTARPSNKHPEGDGPINERRLLMSLKRLCKRCGFSDWKKYKLHTFRHAFASMCARNNVAYKYALEWMGHRSSDILDIYYKQFDDVAEAAIRTIVYSA